MHCWVSEDRVHTILPSEYNADDMGPIYKMSYMEGEVLELMQQNLRKAQRDLKEYERMLAATLRKRGPVEEN